MIQPIKAKGSGSQTDSTQVANCRPSYQMEGTDYLIHPVADLRVYERGTKSRYGPS
jgi:hypothetical protein